LKLVSLVKQHDRKANEPSFPTVKVKLSGEGFMVAVERNV
jgi:hypothetical protein